MADVSRARSVCIDVRRLGRHNCDWPIIKMVWQKVKHILKLEYSIEGLCQLCQGLSTWRTSFLNQKWNSPLILCTLRKWQGDLWGTGRPVGWNYYWLIDIYDTLLLSPYKLLRRNYWFKIRDLSVHQLNIPREPFICGRSSARVQLVNGQCIRIPSKNFW